MSTNAWDPTEVKVMDPRRFMPCGCFMPIAARGLRRIYTRLPKSGSHGPPYKWEPIGYYCTRHLTLNLDAVHQPAVEKYPSS